MQEVGNSETIPEQRNNSGATQEQFRNNSGNSGTIRDAIPKCHPGQMQDANLRNNQERFGNNSGTISKTSHENAGIEPISKQIDDSGTIRDPFCQNNSGTVW